MRYEFILPNGAKTTIVESVFDKNEFKIEKCRNNDDVCYINNEESFGILTVFKSYVKSITVNYLGEVYSLDSSSMYNAWGENTLKYARKIQCEYGDGYCLDSYFYGLCQDKYNCVFRGYFSDAAAAFSAEWAIINGKSVRTVIGHAMETDFLRSINRTIVNAYQNELTEANRQKADNTATFNLNDNLSVTVTKDVFDKNKFIIEKCNHIDVICLINGRVPFGVSLVSYEIPKTYIKNITVNYKGIDYSLDVADMYDMDISKFGGTCPNEYGGICAFRGVFYNDNDSFAAQWWLNINDKSNRRTVLTFSKDIVKWFLKYIDADIFYD
jgi:hypothetical protein